MTGKKNHQISLEEAQQLIKNFRKQNNGIIGGLFDKESILQLLQQPDCVSVRYYFGQNEDGDNVVIMIGVDVKGNDILNGLILEKAFPCPPYCGEKNIMSFKELKELRELV
ncbi:MAG: hypothetical protein H6627_08545 [Calditrichae bacterium]|nr:hypothetical protein [Calditrichota bacterium]MCB9058600.1 hypothetical protein [Calditrichia bacterium]